MVPRTNDDDPERENGRRPDGGVVKGENGPGMEGGSSPGTADATVEGGSSPGTADATVESENGAGTADATVESENGAGTADATVESENGAGTADATVESGSRPATADATVESENGAGATDATASEATGPDQRVAALRRVSAAGRRWRRAQLAGCVVLLAVALTGGSIALGNTRDDGGRAVAEAGGGMSPAALLGGGDLDASVTGLQAHLRAQPRDFGAWATLGLAYVEQARVDGDPSRYPQAEKALDRSLDLRPGNDQALAGRAALAAARHDFTGALKFADQALQRNPYNERALCSRIDTLLELGRYDEAAQAADTADSRRPGIPVFTRYAYVRELRGDVRTARRVLEQALDAAATPADTAYVATALGHLAWNQGDHETALLHYARALAADDGYLPALEGRARAQAASGDRAEAVRGMEAVVARAPLPGPLVALGELYEEGGDQTRAREQYALVDAWTALARAGGVNVDLDTALAAADHGDAKLALRAARAEWDRRKTVHTADALAWALHVNGRDEEALPYARRATATGYRNAAFLYHRGVIELATGRTKEARASLTAAVQLNPGFSPLGAREARAAVKSLEADR
ncbi:tetratricopeptide repeat protein [Streptomyces sp. TRM70350]|uniref:tetratricopeptide repeat protein n=1 Tax=Streptomyces sp. TRM70350 TaxID=2856165 RepID=UPI001C44A818|nr:tetratricopeptide repeat protein [Streptomyces sp. TRM70350]MBV7695294.1 tetratricopeptide repeat protein [Streptomyces sp. TRM70350]